MTIKSVSVFHALPNTRRQLLQGVAATGVCASLWPWPSLAAASPVFDAKSLAQLAKVLGAKSVTASAEVRLSTLDYAENGAAVPVDMPEPLPELTMAEREVCDTRGLRRRRARAHPCRPGARRVAPAAALEQHWRCRR